MEPTQLARELSCWAAEEMRVPQAARPRESTLRRLCLGQGADIWAYIVQHVRSQRSIRTIRGNLLWYGHQDNPKIRRKMELGATAARLRTEIQELDQSLEKMDRETEAQDVAMAQTLQSLKDTQHRALLLQAQAKAVRRQQHGLQDPMQRLQNQLRRLQDMQRKAKEDVILGPLVSAAPAIEPEVLHDVRAACSLRAQFLQKLLNPQAKEGSTQSPPDDHFGSSYQQWLSSVETLLTNHPAGHILAALEYLAAERKTEIWSLCSGDGLKGEETSRPQAPEPSNPSQALPPTVHLIQEGWQAVGTLVTERSELLRERRVLTGRLRDLVEEVERRSRGSNERKVLLLGLRCSGLWAELKALQAQSQELENAAGHRQLLLRELQAKRQRILKWRRLVEETQEQIRLLIKGNSASKTRLSRGPEEVLALLQRKLVPTFEAVAPQSQELLRCLKEEAQQLPRIPLDPLLRRHAEGLELPSRILPSIHQLDPNTPRGPSFISLSHTLGLPVGKAPELLLPKAASLRQDLLFLQDQQGLLEGNLVRMKTSLPLEPSTQELLQLLASQEKEQEEDMGQALRKLMNLMKEALKHIPELQAIVEDWWEQPGQATISEELHQGLSLPQWQLRWAQATRALQQPYK
ncbi:HAUS augmin-like complex subunit 5 isoform X2 [Psammomys obesus]|uniref:HAUS augmin-like complex subunit 5 isoform X2 n=1 Tax=Psammomys obesus TaxID=48139 RepID=UPI002453175D|nr:HAUS augmin-like complex subunit 5 isoform X2 [Psammomys obesus]